MTISSCSSAMSAMDSVARHHKAKLDRVKDFMRFNSVPIEVSNQVLDFYKYIAINSQTKDEYAPAVRPLATACTCPALPRRHTTLSVVLLVCGSLKDFDDLPKHLHIKLTIGLHRALIAKCPLFLEFDCHTIMRILRLLRPCTLPPETVVIRQGCEHTSMFWISRGMCWVIDISKRNADGKPHCDVTLGDQEFFGDEAVMSDQLVCAARSVVTKSYCVLMERTSQLASIRRPLGHRLALPPPCPSLQNSFAYPDVA